MNSVIRKIAEIESTAEAIVEHAENQKPEIEKRIQAERDQFDQKLEEDTSSKLAAIKAEADREMELEVAKQREKNHETLDNLKKEYEENREIYAQEILKRIIEV